ncbi:MAG: TIGR01777 family protein [Gammaproteobacteria bacterium]|nr:TIGR01777 family protein [Gammaproteobacteria bacterium]
MKIFITGISGLIGRALTTELIKRKHTVAGLSRDCERAAKRLPRAVSLVSEFQEATDFLPDAVINLAGAPIADKRWSEARKQTLLASRVSLTEALIQWIGELEHPPEVLLSGSAVGYYGRHGKALLTETAAPHQEFTHELCQRWEQAALQVDERTRVCLLRTGLVIAPQGGFLAKMLTPFRLGLGGPLGSGRQMMSWIHLTDMVQAIIYLLEHSQLQGPFNLTAPQPVSNEAFSRALANQLRRPAFFRMPAILLRLMLGEMSDLLLTGQAVYPERLLEAGYQFQFREVSTALADVLEPS